MSIQRHTRWGVTQQNQRGWVTAEMAFAALGLGLAVVFGAGLVSAGLSQIHAQDAAGQIARQAARGDLGGVREVTQRLPDTAQVSIDSHGTQVVVAVSWEVQPWGTWLPGLVVHSEASVTSEGGNR
ncbi:MAG: hypothetical protein FWG15_05450 [Propionibacteriaceae bacterium]|nr:hypothetical protein [Propionibacteriaceae bacterium]